MIEDGVVGGEVEGGIVGVDAHHEDERHQDGVLEVELEEVLGEDEEGGAADGCYDSWREGKRRCRRAELRTHSGRSQTSCYEGTHPCDRAALV